MNRQAILHIPLSAYAHALDEERVVFRLRAARGDLAVCTLLYGDRSCRKTPVDMFPCGMHVCAQDGQFDWFEAVLLSPFKRICYAFELTDTQGEKLLYYGDQFESGLTADRSEYFQLPYNHRADRMNVPDWMRDAVVYNIFPDSFASGRREISLQARTAQYQGETVRGKLGGTLHGVMQNLDYLRDLGVTCVYLNPIFAAGEYHKYDLIDYYHVDPVFGTDEEFAAVVRRAHELGIRVMIDGVFNHCGWRFFAFRDAVEKGRASRYFDWFYRLEEPVVLPQDMQTYPPYECFGYERMMPKLATDHPDVQAYFCAVGAHWVKEYGIDGWRLDVASEVNDGFWRAFRRAVKAVNPQCALVGEIWETAAHWLDGSMFDSTMNYDMRRHARRFFAEESVDAAAFDARVTDMRMRYRTQAAFAQLNLLSSHDVSRFLSLCGGDERRMRLAALFQMTFIGMPCVFYGDELGAQGVLEEEYRLPMPWERAGCAMHAFYRRAIQLRLEHPALRRGSFACVHAQGRTYHYLRSGEGERIHVALNAGKQEAGVCVPGRILWQEGYDCGILGPYGFVVTME